MNSRISSSRPCRSVASCRLLLGGFLRLTIDGNRLPKSRDNNVMRPRGWIAIDLTGQFGAISVDFGARMNFEIAADHRHRIDTVTELRNFG